MTQDPLVEERNDLLQSTHIKKDIKMYWEYSKFNVSQFQQKKVEIVHNS